ncbi:MAG: PP2C family protein-serine/threonine phosphatase [Anaerolineae bacterium]
MTRENVEEALRDLPFLAGLDQADLQAIAAVARLRSYGAGEVIFREGDRGDEFFVVSSGQVEVVKSIDTEEEQVLDAYERGDFFGEMALLEDRHRSATARAVQGSQLLAIPGDAFERQLQRHPAGLYALTKELSSRLRDTGSLVISRLRDKNRALTDAYEDLKAAQAELLRRERIERDLQLAQGIMDSLIPQEFPEFEGVSLAARIVPAREIGGDFYEAIKLDEDHLGVFICDVVGKSIAAALFVAVARGLILAETERTRSPRTALLRIHRLLLRAAEATSFITMFYGVLDRKVGALRYARAGHEPPILFKGDTAETQILNAPGTLLGILPEVSLEEEEVPFEPGDLLVLYTDGLTEAADPRGEFFGRTRLEELIATTNHLTLEALCQNIVESAVSFQGTAERHDDMAVLAVRFEGERPNQ